MGNPAKTRTIEAMAKRWQRDLWRLESMFGDYGPDTTDDGAEMQRNLGTAITHAHGFLAQFRPQAIK